MKISGPVAISSNPHARRLLIADDNRDHAETFAALVRIAGHTAHIAFDGQSALEVTRREAIDIAVLDIEMPRLNGYEVARQLRTTHGATLLLIAVTGWTGEAERAAARDAGFDVFLTKPLDFGQFEWLLKPLPDRAPNVPESE